MTPPWSDAFAENNHLSFNSCPRTAKRGSISGRHEHAPSFRFLPQRGQMPLQSGLQSSFESMFSTNAVVRISSRSALSPSCRRKVHSSASSSRSSERVSTACTGQETRRSNGAAQRSQTACRFVAITASKTRTPAVLRTVPSAETGSCTGKLPPNCRSCRSSAVWKGRTLSGVCMIFDNPSSIMIPCSIVVQEIL